MIKGIKQRPPLTAEEILQKTNGGYDIIMYYWGEPKALCKRPWGKDNKPSFGFFQVRGLWMWKDAATEESGNAIIFFQKLFNVDFLTALTVICTDFGWMNDGNTDAVAKVTWTAPVRNEKEYAHISFTSQKFQKRHHAFWNCVNVSEEHCNKHECWAVRDLAIKHRLYPIGPEECVFAYYASEEKAVKIYFPERQGDARFRTNVSGGYLWNLKNIESADKLIIQKSMKDLIVTTLLFPTTIAVQSENVKLFYNIKELQKSEIAEELERQFKEIYISYGNDEDGKNKSILITKHTGWKWVNPPNEYMPECNDVYSMVKKHGITSLETMLKSKNLI